jgi:hypothetical protein
MFGPTSETDAKGFWREEGETIERFLNRYQGPWNHWSRTGAVQGKNGARSFDAISRCIPSAQIVFFDFGGVAFMQNGRRCGARSSFVPRRSEAGKLVVRILVLQAGRENRLALFGKLEFVECTVDFGFVAAFGMIFETDSDGLAVGGQCLEGETPPLCFCQTLAQFGFVGNRDASFFRESRNCSKDSLLRLPISLSPYVCGV